MSKIPIANPTRDPKSIPSKVFFNHFYAINRIIEKDTDRFNLRKIPFYNQLVIRNDACQIEKIKKLLWNSWSTEYSLNLASQVNNDDFYKFALHWHFPQAYYAVYLNMTAFHETQGIANDQHEKSIKNFGNSVRSNHYPTAISFFAKGKYNDFEYINLPGFISYPSAFSGLAQIKTDLDAVNQLANFLKSTRVHNAEHKRGRLREMRDKRFLDKKGEFRKKFSKVHWDQIYETIPNTSILNLLYRLRIKANYHDVESFIHAEIDFKNFHKYLGNIVHYLNYIHESYVLKAIGKSKYTAFIDGYPSELIKNTALKRFQEFNI